MITTQRVILYRIADDSDASKFEILNTYDFDTLKNIVPSGLFSIFSKFLKFFYS